MLNSIRSKMLGQNEMYLHKEKVEIAKLTPAKWKKLFATVDQVPGRILQVILPPQEDFYIAVLQAVGHALDEVTRVVAILTEVEESYIEEDVGLDEVVDYLQHMVKLNRLDTAVKNAKSVLPT